MSNVKRDESLNYGSTLLIVNTFLHLFLPTAEPQKPQLRMQLPTTDADTLSIAIAFETTNASLNLYIVKYDHDLVIMTLWLALFGELNKRRNKLFRCSPLTSSCRLIRGKNNQSASDDHERAAYC